MFCRYRICTFRGPCVFPNLICRSSEEDGDNIHHTESIDEFLEALEALTEVEDDKRRRKVITFFHNLGGFDGNFILEALYDRAVENSLTTGAKIIYFESGDLIFKDSLNFFAMPLEKFPATFNLTELHKWYFPHAFNRECHFNYSGRYPPKEDYDPDSMASKKREKFLTWYDQKVASNAVFDFQEELLKYCQSDVKLLKEGCPKFVQEFEEIAGFNPLIQSVTIASACNYLWREEKLKEDLIVLEPSGGWHGNHINQSEVALQWLYFQDHQRGGMGRGCHVGSGGEIQVLTPGESYYVDGFDQETNTVFEFYGYFYHGCPRCFKTCRDVKRNCHKDRTVNEVYDATLKKASMLRLAGYEVIEKWECDFKEEKKTNPQLKAFLKDLEMVPPLNPREAFYGGRTEAVHLHCKVQDPDIIKYSDVTSLYPWVNKYKEYLVRFLVIYTNLRDQEIHHCFGTARVDILPPEMLFHPVLPYRAGGKLTFPSCRACVEKEQVKPWLERTNICAHTDQERMLRGTWATIELQKAVEPGYQILKIHKVWHFRKEDRKVELFADCVKTWLKIKQESAGWPEECRSRAEKQAYLREYREKEGIQLEHVAKNLGRKQVAKVMLNR